MKAPLLLLSLVLVSPYLLAFSLSTRHLRQNRPLQQNHHTIHNGGNQADRLSIALKAAKQPNDGLQHKALDCIRASPSRTACFSVLVALAGAALGPFLDSYHSLFGVLIYDTPITARLWGDTVHPALVTSWWVPELFGLAGFIIGWLYILLDILLEIKDAKSPSVPRILIGISIFTLQYWLSGVLYQSGVDRTTILNVMSVMAATGFVTLDGSLSGLVTSAATAVGGPLIEVGLLTLSRIGILGESGYHYTDLGETGFFPLWIAPVYFLGGPAVGNLARGIWNGLSESVEDAKPKAPAGCQVCDDTRRVPCPNCDGAGQYVAMGGRPVTCTSCRGRGFVICRACFAYYGEDPNDIQAIREKMSRMPD